MRVPGALRWTGLAVLGIVIAALVSVAASRLASQQIGLDSEPISAGDALVPAQIRHRAVAAEHRRSQSRNSNGPGNAGHHNPPPSPPPPSPPPPSPPTQPAIPAPPAPIPSTPEVEPRQAGGDGEHSSSGRSGGGGGADD